MRLILNILGRDYDAGEFEGTIEEGISFFGSSLPASRSFPVAFYVDDVDVRSLIVRSHGLHGVTGRLVRDDGRTLLRGHLERVQWRTSADPIRATLQEEARSGELLVGPSETLLDAGRYPEVWGRPGWDRPSSPAKYVTIDGSLKLVVAGHPVDAVACVIWGRNLESDEWEGVGRTIELLPDDDGRAISVVDPLPLINVQSGQAEATFGPNEPLFVAWPSAARSGRLGSVVRDLLREVPWLVDADRQAAFLPKLNSYEVDFWLEEPVDSLELLAEILAPFPVALVQGRDGVYVWAWDPNDSPRLHLEVGAPGVVGQSDPRVDSTPLRSHQIRFRQTAIADDAMTLTTDALTPYHRLAASNEHGEIGDEEAPYLSSISSAQRCADLRARALALPPIMVQIEVDQSLDLRAGDCVSVRWDDAAILSKRTGWVTLVTEGGSVGRVTVEITIPYDLEAA